MFGSMQEINFNISGCFFLWLYKEYWLYFVYRGIFTGKPNPTHFDPKYFPVLLKN